MKLKNKLFAYVYRNHNGNLTKTPFRGKLYRSIDAANYYRKSLAQEVKKNLKIVRVTLETI